MKRVSFKVAKSLKKAGYPQIFIDVAYYEDNKLHHTEDPYNNCRKIIAYAPTYLEVWLWLWREKKIDLQMLGYKNGKAKCYIERSNIHEDFLSEMCDPEEAIVAAIDYLVENDLIK